jgi:CRP-like cAMP-binding protein
MTTAEQLLPPVPLLQLEPDLGRYLSREDRANALALRVGLADLGEGAHDLGALVSERHAVGVIVVGGLALKRMRAGRQAAVELVGPGDIVLGHAGGASALGSTPQLVATGPLRIAPVGGELLLGLRRWPALMVGVLERIAEQSARVSEQLLICQLPRVGDRILALLWLLADSWGRVTPAGVTVPFALTHETIGTMIGARRPTVTLAFGELVERGAIVRQDEGWLLLEGIPEALRADGDDHPPPKRPLAASAIELAALWSAPAGPSPAQDLHETGRQLLATYERMRREHADRERQLRLSLGRLRATREQIGARRAALRSRRA